MDICALGLFITSQYLINVILGSEINPHLWTNVLMFVLGPCLVVQYKEYFYLCNRITGEERGKVSCFTLIYLISCGD